MCLCAQLVKFFSTPARPVRTCQTMQQCTGNHAELSRTCRLQRFNSDSALASCTQGERRVLQTAAIATEQHLTVRQAAQSVHRGARDSIEQISRLSTDARDVRASQERFRSNAHAASATFSAQTAAVTGMAEQSIAVTEQRIESLTTMAEHVQQATEVLQQNYRSVSRSRARKGTGANGRSESAAPQVSPRPTSADARRSPETRLQMAKGTLLHIEAQLQEVQGTDAQLAARLPAAEKQLAELESVVVKMEVHEAAMQRALGVQPQAAVA